ncbi:MAG: hypothetical protein AAGG69_10055 [Pseudomonadota bacterium]
MRTQVLSMSIAAATAAIPCAVAEPIYSLERTETGLREYYCQATFDLTADGPSRFADVNGFFYVFVGEQQVGRSKGASFRFDDGATSASATFETPNAPCDDIDGYVFVVGACMEGRSFADRNECAATIATGGLVKETKGR